MAMTEEELSQKSAELEQREARLKADRLRFELGSALQALNVRAEAMADATALFAQLCAPEYGADGRVSSLRIGDDAYETVGDAASAFLASRAYLKDSAPSKATPASAKPEPKPGDGFLSTPPATTYKPPAETTRLPKGRASELLDRGYNTSDLVNEGWANPPR